jgi:hypothetical protein
MSPIISVYASNFFHIFSFSRTFPFLLHTSMIRFRHFSSSTLLCLPPSPSFSAFHIPISLAHFSDTFPHFSSLTQLFLPPSPSVQLLTFPFLSDTSRIRFPHFSFLTFPFLSDTSRIRFPHFSSSS